MLGDDAYFPHDRNYLPDGTPIAEEGFRFWATAFRSTQDLLKVAQSQIAVFMNQNFEANLPVPADVTDAARRIQELVRAK